MVEERGVKRVSMEDKEGEKASKVAFSFFLNVAEAHLSIIKKKKEERNSCLTVSKKFLVSMVAN